MVFFYWQWNLSTTGYVLTPDILHYTIDAIGTVKIVVHCTLLLFFFYSKMCANVKLVWIQSARGTQRFFMTFKLALNVEQFVTKINRSRKMLVSCEGSLRQTHRNFCSSRSRSVAFNVIVCFVFTNTCARQFSVHNKTNERTNELTNERNEPYIRTTSKAK